VIHVNLYRWIPAKKSHFIEQLDKKERIIMNKKHKMKKIELIKTKKNSWSSDRTGKQIRRGE
jgi:hypothetical protein